jgi:hypothetical protein
MAAQSKDAVPREDPIPDTGAWGDIAPATFKGSLPKLRNIQAPGRALAGGAASDSRRQDWSLAQRQDCRSDVADSSSSGGRWRGV